MGELATVEDAGDLRRLAVETFGGLIHVEWDPQAAVTALGGLPFFVEYLKQGALLTARSGNMFNPKSGS